MTSSPAPRIRVRAKLLEWIARYGLAEIAGIGGALLAVFIVRRLTTSAVAAGYAGTCGETLGYVGAIAARDFLTAHRDARASGQKLGARARRSVIVQLLVELGPAGVIDTILIRPLAMAAGVRWLGPVIGLLAGKIVGDVGFYVPVIMMYERRRRRERHAE
ncbi:MAG TPA: hypothetical protein VHB78_15260 [Vicinamibacterales bacterium]|nr:hypothetical protein [Vicinamibacterales bacterium]